MTETFIPPREAFREKYPDIATSGGLMRVVKRLDRELIEVGDEREELERFDAIGKRIETCLQREPKFLAMVDLGDISGCVDYLLPLVRTAQT
jgi:hypothetical protein